jgi:amidohydrolase
MEATREPSVITVGAIRGGVRDNIIPDTVELLGTVRAFDEDMRVDLAERIERTATHIALASGASADVQVHRGYDVTINHPGLMAQMLPTLKRVAGEGQCFEIQKITGAEDFSFYQQKVPGIFFFVGVTPPERDMASAASIHSPRFYLDEAALKVGIRALAHLTLDYLNAP